jgi:hypothetical protein
MVSRSAITKAKTLFIIDVIIVAIAAGSYLYLLNTGELAFASKKPAEFTVTDLTINPLEAGFGEPILISANVTNVGDEEGSYSVNFTINDVLKENRTILLSGGNSSIVEFTDIENAAGNYLVKTSGINGTFTITNKPPPSTLKISYLIHSPYEAWENETITISVNVTNTGNEAISYSLPFRVNNVVIGVKAIQLSAGETQTVNCTVTESSIGTYPINVGGLTGSFTIVPTGYHTLKVVRSGSGSKPMTFTLDGASYPTPHTELLPVGTHTVIVKALSETETALFGFVQWNDGDTSTEKEINLQSYMILIATYRLISGFASCPSLFVWNGTNYAYRTEVSGSNGYLPYFVCFGENGTQVFGYTDPLDYIKLDNSQIQLKNGYYDMTLRQLWDEIFYLDSAWLLVVDHSPDVDVYSTMGTKKYSLEGQGTIYTVSKNPLAPISAVNGKKENVLPQISKLDGISTTGSQFQWNTLELNLGNLSTAKEIKLIVVGNAVWPSNEESGEWIAKFVTQPGVEPYPVQYMEVKNANGSWMRVPDNRQFPMLDVDSTAFVVNLTGLFPTNDYSLRINTFFDTRFDYIGVDTTPQQSVKIRKMSPVNAYLTQLFETNSTSTGSFTRFGDVTELMRYADDKFVIGRRGDEIQLKFNAAEVGGVPPGMKRDYFFIASCWFKSPGLPYLAFTVDPIPFHAMSAFPYPPTESYPHDAAHLSYLREYNTRTIPVPRTQLTVGDTLGGTIVTGLELAGILVTFIWIKERAWRSRLPRIKSARGQ